jgi:hypothetical protein
LLLARNLHSGYDTASSEDLYRLFFYQDSPSPSCSDAGLRAYGGEGAGRGECRTRFYLKIRLLFLIAPRLPKPRSVAV